jgi:hypothetical protein
MQIGRCVEARNLTIETPFINSVDALVLLLPPVLIDSVENYKNQNNFECSKKDYDLLFRRILKAVYWEPSDLL